MYVYFVQLAVFQLTLYCKIIDSWQMLDHSQRSWSLYQGSYKKAKVGSLTIVNAVA